MTGFWLGFLSVFALYLLIGSCIGIYVIFTHLAHFFAGGWQIKRMFKYFCLVTLFWPSVIFGVA